MKNILLGEYYLKRHYLGVRNIPEDDDAVSKIRLKLKDLGDGILTNSLKDKNIPM